MDETFLTFQLFTDGMLAEKFAARLELCGIPYKLVYDSISSDPENVPRASEVRIKIMQKDFSEAYKELADYYKNNSQASSPNNDYYLSDCSDDELIEIVSKPAEWDQFDLSMAEKILKERGVFPQSNTKEIIEGTRQKDIIEIEPEVEIKQLTPVIELKPPVIKKIKPPRENKNGISKPAGKKWFQKSIKWPDKIIWFGYLAAIFLSPVGIYIGWSFAYSKKDATDTSSDFSYPAEIRSHGEKILIIAITITIALVPILITRAL
ncbi:MAG: hypothetical protein ACJ748_12305 [Flavisolibacter sp.]